MSDVQNIISQLEQQRDAIERAISALRDINPAQAAAVQAVDRAQPAERGSRGHITPEGRSKLAEENPSVIRFQAARSNPTTPSTMPSGERYQPRRTRM